MLGDTPASPVSWIKEAAGVDLARLLTFFRAVQGTTNGTVRGAASARPMLVRAIMLATYVGRVAGRDSSADHL